MSRHNLSKNMLRRRKMFSLRIARLAVLAFSYSTFILPAATSHAADMIDNRYRLEIHNHSEVEIYNIYVSRSSETGWGRDRLAEDTLTPRHYLPIENVVPGEYDFLIVDEYGRRCMKRDYQIFKDTEWDITDEWLDRCKSLR
jgi:hypothetical protein